MKILQVITSLDTGGAETLVVNMVPKLRALGHEVDVCVFNGADTPLMHRLIAENPKVKVWKLGRGYYNPLYIWKLARIMRGYDIVHTHNSSPQLFVAFAKVLCSVVHNPVRLCTTEHNTSNRKRDWKWYAPIESWMYHRYHHIICISQIAEDKLREYMGGVWFNESSKHYHKISTINNGVDVEAIHQAQSLDEAQNPSVGKFVVTMVAGFRQAKDQDTVVKALKHLPTDCVVWLVGIGERMEKVQTLAESEGMKDRVVFWGRREDVPRLLKSSSVIVMSSHWEGLSLSNIEGMSAGKPFVASDVNGLREVTKGYGVLFPESDEQALAHCLQQLHDDSDYYQTVAKRCYQRAKEFDLSTMVKKYNAIYQSVINHTND